VSLVRGSLLLATLLSGVPSAASEASDIEAQYRQAVARAEEERHAEAIALLSEIVDLDSTHHRAMAFLGSLHAEMDPADYDGAISSLTRAIELSPLTMDYWRELGRVQAGAGRLEDAVASFEQVLQHVPDDTTALINLGYLYQQEPVRQLDRAIECAERAQRLAPWNLTNYMNLGYAYEKRGDFENARRYYRLLQRNFPRHDHQEWVAEHLRKVSGSAYRLLYTVELSNRGPGVARDVELWVMVGRDFPPHTRVELVECHPEWERVVRDSIGHVVAGFKFEEIGPGEVRSAQLGYEINVGPVSYKASPSTPLGYAPESIEYAYYTSAERFIESDAQLVRKVALEHADGGPDRLESARRLYDFVIDTLDYEVQTETYGALAALKAPERTDCTEFAALFVALARAIRIPARIVFGFIYDQENPTSEQAHTWAEFLLPDGRWIPVDPTFGQRFSEEYFARVSAHHLALWVPSRLLEGSWSYRAYFSVRGSQDASLVSGEYARIFPVGGASGDSTETWMAEEIAGAPTVSVLPTMTGRRIPLSYVVGIAALFFLWVTWRHISGTHKLAKPRDLWRRGS